MSYVIATPDLLASAAADAERISTALNTATAAAAGPTTSFASMAADEVSTTIARLFSGYAQLYQGLSAQAAAFHEEFVRALAAGGAWYAETEAANATLTQMVATGTGASALTSMPTPAASLSLPITALVLGASGQPIPGAHYINLNQFLYIQPLFPGAIAQGLNYPASLYPATGIKALTFDASVSQGVTIMENAILQQIQAGNNVVVFADSQSSTVSGMAMQQLAALPAALRPTTSQLAFILTGDPSNPNGGLLERFEGLSLPSIGFTFSGATPDNLYPTHMYTIEYDGFADFPQYPINFPADLNAVLGDIYAHTQYQNLTTLQINSAIPLPTQGPTMTNYYMVPTQNLPLLDPLRLVPYVGNPLADLLQPDLTTIVNLGYGNPDYGWSQGPANVPTPFGLFPHVNQATILSDLVSGADQGIGAAMSDLRAEGFPSLSSLSLSSLSLSSLSLSSLSLPSLSMPSLSMSDMSMPSLSMPSLSMSDLSHAVLTAPSALATYAAALPNIVSLDGLVTASTASLTNVANEISSAIATGASLAHATGDLLLVLGLTLPSYDFNLFLDGVEQVLNGNPVGFINAIGYPVAADTGIITLGIGIEVYTVANALGLVNGI